MRASILFLSLLALSALAGCDGGGATSGDGGPRVDAARDSGTGTGGETAEQLYLRLCASCHGEAGEGGIGVALIDTPRTEDELFSIIDTRMPQGAPERCDANCARVLAHYVKTTFTSAALACDGVGPGPRALRLLTRREYRATVRDLLDLPTDALPPSACNLRTITYDPGGRALTSVSLAGSFNGWSASAWPMTWDAASARWTISRELADGDHQYKFVLNGTEWIRDAANPDTADDGFGGLNSVLRVSCGAPPSTIFDPASSLPVETRGESFFFDDESAGGIVTDVHVSEHLKAARLSVEAAADHLDAIVGCDVRADRAGCTDSFIRAFGRRALRRPLTDVEVARYRDLALAQADAMDGVRAVIRALLVSPHFVYRSETGEAQPDGTFLLTPFELATAISYQLWGTTPDDALLDAAASGSLSTPAGLEAEARRLLADPRARQRTSDFALMWLGVEGVEDETKNAALFPGWSSDLASAMEIETARFAEHVVFDGTHGIDELFTADYGFVNETLARHYGIAGVTGATFVQATYPAGTRAGILSHASVLASYAHSDQGSPIQRGLFVRRNLLCQTFPLPPADAGGVPDVDPSATTRERFAMHTSRPSCAGCHQYIDSVGFGFEAFDATGAFRTMEGGLAIDTSGDLTDVEGLGTRTSAPYASMPELGAILAASDSAEDCFVRQYRRFARGYRETLEDRCAVRALVDEFRAGGDIRELMISVILAPDYARRADRGAP